MHLVCTLLRKESKIVFGVFFDTFLLTLRTGRAGKTLSRLLLDFGSRGCGDSCILGKSKGGLTKGGLSPKFSEKIGGKSFLRNRAFSGQIGTFSGTIGAFSGPIGTNSSAPHSHGGRAEIVPKGPFLAQLAPFGPSPPLLSPPLDFPEYMGIVIVILDPSKKSFRSGQSLDVDVQTGAATTS